MFRNITLILATAATLACVGCNTTDPRSYDLSSIVAEASSANKLSLADKLHGRITLHIVDRTASARDHGGSAAGESLSGTVFNSASAAFNSIGLKASPTSGGTPTLTMTLERFDMRAVDEQRREGTIVIYLSVASSTAKAYSRRVEVGAQSSTGGMGDLVGAISPLGGMVVKSGEEDKAMKALLKDLLIRLQNSLLDDYDLIAALNAAALPIDSRQMPPELTALSSVKKP